ncbi:hypothetical protein PAXRUDRAFT_130147, partial [Paxillus rubicundulus Ve08.2h10]
SWFQTYSLLIPPHPITFRDNSTTSTIGIGMVTLFSTIPGKKCKIILTNISRFPDFQISLIPINCLSTARLSTVLPASSSICYVQKGRTHQQGLYHTNVILESPKAQRSDKRNSLMPMWTSSRATEGENTSTRPSESNSERMELCTRPPLPTLQSKTG